MNEIHQLMVYAKNIIISDENMNTIKKNTEAEFDASREVGLEVSIEKTTCMFMSRHQNAGQSHNLLIAIKYFKNVAKLQYLRKRAIN
jgi:hypothetical protein